MEGQENTAQVSPAIEVPSQMERHTTINTSKPSSNHRRLPNRQNILTDNSPTGKQEKARDVGHNISAPSNAEQRRRRSQSTSSWAQRAFMQTFTIAVIDSPAGASALIILPRHVFPCGTLPATFLE
ncbi:uncharacterized protein EAE97_001988 [Botrytis byssoidea]|uniref:Uncharacterized protein n=1 Tax=Botrytis byssoidea TaxID=139641 RepID=A0A9P5ISW5_9HELO|nr:uncharacterized protein EAE97_001988 [Botrytis byssoidea]KAF7952491.1 hypothetical protein EAE97_001988 [Botrytis byssoidea]